MRNRLHLAVSLLYLFIASPAILAAGWWEYSYEADVSPAEAFPPWSLAESQVKSGMTIRENLQDGVLAMTCRGSEAQHYYHIGLAGSALAWRTDSGKGNTAEIRVRVRASVPGVPAVGIFSFLGFGTDKGRAVTIQLMPAGVNLAGQDVPLDWSRFHVFRLTFDAAKGMFFFYIDHKPTPVCRRNLKEIAPGDSRSENILFGYTYGPAMQGAMDVDYIRWTNQGAWVPDGKSYPGPQPKAAAKPREVKKDPVGLSPAERRDADIIRANDLIVRWARYPFLAVPLAVRPPIIDGVVDAAEWRSASCLKGVVSMATRHVSGKPSSFYSLHDEKNVYIAFQLDRPDRAKPKVLAHGRVEGLWNREDGVELVLSPDTSRSTAFSLYINGGSGYSEGYVISGSELDSSRRGAWTIRSRVTDRGLEGELQISRKAFDDVLAKARASIDTRGWGFDPMRTDVLPAMEMGDWTDLWGGDGGYNGRRLGTLAFRNDHLAVRMETPGALDDTHVGLRGTLANGDGREVKARLTYALYQSTVDVRARQIFLYQTWDKVNRIRTTGSDFEEGKVAQLLLGEGTWLKNLGRAYRVVKEGALDLSAGANKVATFAVPLDQAGGQFIFAGKLTDKATGQVLWAQTVPVEVKPKLDLEVAKRFLTLDGIVVTMDVSGSEKAQAGDVIKGRIRQARGGAPVATWESTVTGKFNPVQKLIPLKDCIPGDYTVEATLVSKGKGVLAANTTRFSKPAPPAWWHNRIGYSNEVPWPFIAVKATERETSMWGRTYGWEADNALPARIVSQGKSLLAAPMELRLVSQGRELTWKTEDWKLESTTPRMAKYATRLTAGDFVLKLIIHVDFDGLMRFTGELEGTGQPIESLKLLVPLEKERVTHYHVGQFETDLRTADEGYRAGRIEEFKTAFPSGAAPFAALFWLGGDDGGIQWIAEWDKGWQNPDRRQVMAVAQGARSTTLQISLIAQETRLARPLPIDFAFNVSPVRDMSYYWDKKITVINGGSGAIDPGKYNPTQLKADMDRERAHGANHIMTGGFGWPFHADIWLRDHNRPHFKENVATVHAAGLKYVYYGCWGYSSNGDESPDFGKDMIKLPLLPCGTDTYWYNAEGPWVDFFMAGLDWAVREMGIDGIYLDSMPNAHMVADPLLGQAYTDEQGNIHGKYPIFALRDWALRMLNVFHITHRTDGMVYQHQSGLINLAICSLADLRCGGEEAPSTYSLKGSWPLDSYAARYNNHFFGVPSETLWYNWWNRPIKENQAWAVILLHGQVKNKEPSNYLYSLPPDYELPTTPTRDITTLLQGFDVPHAQWWPYYGKRQWITLTPAGLYASAYVHPGKRALVVVSNLDKSPVKAKVTFDLAKTGFREGGVKVTDAFLKTDVPMVGSAINLDIQGERYRLLLLEAK